MIAELRELTRPCKRCKGSGRLPLTARAVRVLALVGRGMPNKQIAVRLGTSEETVSMYKCGHWGNRECGRCKGRGRIPLPVAAMRTMELVRDGRSNKEIAARIEIPEMRVKKYVSRALKATGLENRTQLALFLKGVGNLK